MGCKQTDFKLSLLHQVGIYIYKSHSLNIYTLHFQPFMFNFSLQVLPSCFAICWSVEVLLELFPDISDRSRRCSVKGGDREIRESRRDTMG